MHRAPVVIWTALKELFSRDSTSYPFVAETVEDDVEFTTAMGRKNPETQLYQAVVRGNLKTVKHLVFNEGVSVNLKFADGSFPLHVAAERGYTELVTFLLSMKALTDVRNQHGQTPLMLGIGTPPIVKALINYKCGVDKTDNQRRSALHLASLKVLPDVVEMLLCAGARCQATDRWWRTPLHTTLLFIANSQTSTVAWLRVMEVLIKHGNPINAKDRNSITPLYLAATSGSIEATQLLLDRGARCDQPSRHNLTPLMVTVLKGYTELCKLFLRKNCRLDAKYPHPTSRTILQMAVVKGHGDIAQFLYVSNPGLVHVERWLWLDRHTNYTWDDDMLAWLRGITSGPASLKMLSRDRLRRHMGYGVEQKVQQLGCSYPEVLKGYILLSDL